MNRIDRQELAKSIHQTAVNKGWWEGNRNLIEARMLIITELAEAVEADRSNKRSDDHSFNTLLPEQLSINGRRLYEEDKPYIITQHDKDVFKENFKKWIKDSVEDELADAYIRILDLMYFESHNDLASYMGDREHLDEELDENFASAIYQICNMVDKSLSFTLYLIEDLCEREEIDLHRHVGLKMKYNQMRPKKHGGKKY